MPKSDSPTPIEETELSLTRDELNKLLKENGELKTYIVKLEAIQKKYNDLQAKLEAATVQNISRKMRFYGLIMQGLATSGHFSQDKMKAYAGKEQILFEHIAGLAQIATKVAEEKL